MVCWWHPPSCRLDPPPHIFQQSSLRLVFSLWLPGLYPHVQHLKRFIHNMCTDRTGCLTCMFHSCCPLKLDMQCSSGVYSHSEEKTEGNDKNPLTYLYINSCFKDKKVFYYVFYAITKPSGVPVKQRHGGTKRSPILHFEVHRISDAGFVN